MKLNQSFNPLQQQKQSQTQQMAMTQQLQQSIQMLSYTNDELQQFIENKALENPFLDVDWHEHNYESLSTQVHYDSDQIQQYIEQLPNKYQSLYKSLEDQIYLNYRKTPIREEMLKLLSYIDDNGYLTVDLEQLVTDEVPETMLLDALTLLQQLEPAGVGARNLQECLLLQIERDNTAPALAYLVLEESFEPFINHKWEDLTIKYDMTLAELQTIADYLLNLTPHPGNIFTQTMSQSIIPELTLRKENDKLFLTINKFGQPTVTFETDYYQQIAASADKQALKFAKEKKNEVSWIQKSLKQRQETIFEVGNAIVEHQKAFFLDQKAALKPLSLKDLATKLNLHESTISRSVNGKYLETWFGIFELKSFFAKKIGTSDVTTDEIKDTLKKIINNEDKTKPLSDQKLVDQLTSQGYKVSRRTIAKYRDELNIPSSSKRKRYL